MKLALLAVPVVAAAGWGGTTLYVAQETESSFEQMAETMRVQGIQVESQSYEKGFRTSTARTVLSGEGGSLSAFKDFAEPLNRLADGFALEHAIEHGPVVLSGGVEALAGRVTTTLDMDSVDPEITKAWLAACDCDQPLLVASEIDLLGGSSHSFDFQALAFELENNSTLNFGGLKGETSIDASGLVSSKGTTGALSLVSDEGSLKLDAGDWEFSGKKLLEHFAVGEGAFNFPLLSLDADGKSNVFKGLKGVVASDITDGGLDTKVSFKVDSMQMADLPVDALSDFQLDVAMNRLPVDEMLSFTDKMADIDMSEAEGNPFYILELYRDLIVPGVGLEYGLSGTIAGQGAFDSLLKLSYQPTAGTGLDDIETVGDLVSSLHANLTLSGDAGLLDTLGADVSQNPMLAGFYDAAKDQYSVEASLADGVANLNGMPFPIGLMFAEQFAQPLPSIEEMKALAEAAEQGQ